MVDNKKKLAEGKVTNSLYGQLRKSSNDRSMNILLYGFKRYINYLLETIAYNCPINSWRVKFHKLRGVNIQGKVHIGRRCTLDHAYPEHIYLEDGVALTGDNYILAHSAHTGNSAKSLASYKADVIIKKGSLIGVRAVILPGVTIGEGSIVGAGAVVGKNVPPNTVVATAKNRVIPLVVSE